MNSKRTTNSASKLACCARVKNGRQTMREAGNSTVYVHRKASTEDRERRRKEEILPWNVVTTTQ